MYTNRLCCLTSFTLPTKLAGLEVSQARLTGPHPEVLAKKKKKKVSFSVGVCGHDPPGRLWGKQQRSAT